MISKGAFKMDVVFTRSPFVMLVWLLSRLSILASRMKQLWKDESCVSSKPLLMKSVWPTVLNSMPHRTRILEDALTPTTFNYANL